MKKLISTSRVAAWAYILVLAASLLTLLLLPLNIKTDMLSLLPTDKNNLAKEKAFDAVAKVASQKVIILFGNADKKTAYQTAIYFYEQIKNNHSLEQINFHLAPSDKNQLLNLYFPYRYQLLSASNQQQLKNHQGNKTKEKALRNLYAGVGINAQVKEDPFLLSNDFIMSLPFFQTSLFPYEDILMTQREGKYYAFLSLTLAKDKVFSTSELAEAVEPILAAEKNTNQQFPNSEIIISGVAIHSYVASTKGMSEVNIIGWISFLGILPLLYFSFRSLAPFFFSTFSTLAGFAIAFSATRLVFGEVHLLTIVFGTSLIGVGVDYSLHFFCEYAARKKQKNLGFEVIKKIFPAITMGLITSLIGYLALIFTPFPGLKQIAFFSNIGLIAAYGSVVIFFPIFYKAPNINYHHFSFYLSKKFLNFFEKYVSLKTATYIFIILAMFSAIGIYRSTPNDDIRLLYSSPKNLIDREILTRNILNQRKAIQFFLVTGKTPQEVLEKEEDLRAKIDQSISEKVLSSYQAISQIVPSFKRQKENYDLVSRELLAPYLKQQAAALGLKAKQTSNIKTFFKSRADHCLTLEEALTNPTLSILKPLWLDKLNGSFGSVILLDNVVNAKALKALADENAGIYLMDKVEDISNIFRDYRSISVKLLIIVHILIALLLVYRYGFYHSIFIFLPPTLSGTMTIAMLSLLGYSINLFNILGLFLILGIGVDYATFYAEGKDHPLSTSLAIMLSALSALLSFCLLAFSSFPVIHSFGLTIFFGILFSYLLSPIATLSAPRQLR